MGSKKWLQLLVNEHPKIIDQLLVEELKLGDNETIDWRSPLEKDNYDEYRDSKFLAQLGLDRLRSSLKGFWPKGGAVWDGLATTSGSKVILIEAKSHIPEIVSSGTGAKENSLSLELIRKSLQTTKDYLGSNSKHDWSSTFYQYTNRLAHLYWLREKCDVDAFLVYVCFLNDTEMKGPPTVEEWKGAITLLESVLSVRRHKLSKFCSHIYVDVSELI